MLCNWEASVLLLYVYVCYTYVMFAVIRYTYTVSTFGYCLVIV